MPRRFSLELRLWIYRYLVARDGEYCRLCGRAPSKPGTLEIDHIDDDNSNDDPENLQFACSKCNKLKELKRQGQRKKKVHNVSLEGSPATRIVKGKVDYSLGSPEMQANSHFEVKYRKWLIKEIATKEAVDKKEAINSGAELVGCSPITIGRYTDKLLSANGPLQETKDFMNTTLLLFKDEVKQALLSLCKNKATKKNKKEPAEETPAETSKSSKAPEKVLSHRGNNGSHG